MPRYASVNPKSSSTSHRFSGVLLGAPSSRPTRINSSSGYELLDKQLSELQESPVAVFASCHAQAPIGRGGNAEVFDIPGTDFVLRVQNQWGAHTNTSPEFYPPIAVPDPIPFNVGQPVAQVAKNAWILYRQQGRPAGASSLNKEPSVRLHYYKERLREAAEMPQSSYDQLMQEIQELHRLGYQIDPSKSSNLLIDAENQRFNIVDVNPGRYIRGAEDVLILLWHPYFLRQNLNDAEIVSDAYRIYQKLLRYNDGVEEHVQKSQGDILRVFKTLEQNGQLLKANPRKSSAHRFSGVLLAKKWDNEDPTGWWMSEKLDGIRAYWTGSKLVTRNGNEIHAPAWFTDSLPSIALDGELIVGRGKFNKTVSAVKKKTPNEAEWKTVLYRVFDAPSVPGPCEKRWTAMKAAIRGLKHVKAVDQVKCKGAADLKKYHAKITQLGGEGVMLREPGSAYEKKRSSTLLKVKSFDDAEAKIVGYTEGTGRHKGRLGAYEAVLVGSRKKFKIGTGISDSERDDPLPIGTIVTVKFQELTPDGVPRFPSLVGARDYE
jgi:DNA ligase-1